MLLVQQLGLAERFDRQMLTQIIPLLRRLPELRLAFPLTVDSLLQRGFQRWLRDTLLQSERPLRQRILIELNEAKLCAHQARLVSILRLRGAQQGRVVDFKGKRDYRRPGGFFCKIAPSLLVGKNIMTDNELAFWSGKIHVE